MIFSEREFPDYSPANSEFKSIRLCTLESRIYTLVDIGGWLIEDEFRRQNDTDRLEGRQCDSHLFQDPRGTFDRAVTPKGDIMM